MKLRNLILGSCCSFLLALPVQAQQTSPAPGPSDSIEIGGMSLRLGMEQNSVIHSLSEQYSLHEIGAATAAVSSWMAETKSGPPYVAVANVVFVGGRLSSIYKFWSVGSEPVTKEGFAGILTGAVARFEQENKAPCVVATNTLDKRAVSWKPAIVTCQGRQKFLSLDLVPMGNGQEGVSLAEVLKYLSEDVAVPEEMDATDATESIEPSAPAAMPARQALLEKTDAKALVSPRIRRTKADDWVPPDVDQDVPPVAPGAACPLNTVLSNAAKRVQQLVKNVDRFTATEVVEHQGVDKTGQLRPPEIRNFNYLVSIAQSPSGRMNVEEYRNGGSNPEQFPDHIATVGTPSLILIFHAEHAKDFRMTCEGLGQWLGQPAWQVRFEERPESNHRISAFVVSGRTFGLRLRGRAWILANSYQVARLETDLAAEVPEIRLRLQHQDIEYRPVHFNQGKTEMWLPSTSDFYMDFRGHRFYRRHRFTDFKLFSVGMQQSVGDPQE